MNQLRRTFFGSDKPNPATAPQASSQAGPPRLSVPIDESSIDASELSTYRSGDMATTEVQSQGQSGSLTGQDAGGSKGGRGQGQAVACPDPSAHQHGTHKLSDQASKAALYVTHPERATNQASMNPLGPDGKLSSAGN